VTTGLQKLRALSAEVADLRHAADLLEWDERVCMPNGGATTHGEMLATLRRIAHEKFTSSEMHDAIESARADATGLDDGGRAQRLVDVTARDYDKATKVPASFVAEYAEAVSAGQQAWGHARAQSDFSAFKPFLEKIVALKRRYVSFFPPTHHPYDVLLDDFEPSMTTVEVRTVFEALRSRQVELIRTVGAAPPPQDGFLRAPYAESDMLAFAVEVITAFGFDWTRGRQDKSLHPFATAIGADDVRITTRWVEGMPLSLLFGTMHETGHALYEQGVRSAHHRTALEGGASLGVHESQSRLWENLVGRSLPFWQHFYPQLQARFPSQLSGVALEQFHRAINKVQPSLIRVEADEATYNLHVMLRVDLEIALIEGAISVDDLPDRWNAGMREYLGLTPPDAARGVLQDIHWSAGLFGYFATYTLGNVIAAQLWRRFGDVYPQRDSDIGRGEFRPLLQWLRAELHQYGREYRPQELVQRITGSGVDPEPYLQYLEGKYGRLTAAGLS
jgi:carboxypeptidase Taq